MAQLIALIMIGIYAMGEPSYTSYKHYDFGRSNGGDYDWRVIVDGVMGGRSQGELTVTDHNLIFSGTISLENNGGFASLKSPFGKYDLAGCNTVSVRFRSSGQRFYFTLENHRRFYMPNYKHLLAEIPTGEWQTVEIPLNTFAEYRMGDPTGSGVSRQILSNIIRLGFINADKQAGEFKLEIDQIEFR